MESMVIDYEFPKKERLKRLNLDGLGRLRSFLLVKQFKTRNNKKEGGAFLCSEFSTLIITWAILPDMVLLYGRKSSKKEQFLSLTILQFRIVLQ